MKLNRKQLRRMISEVASQTDRINELVPALAAAGAVGVAAPLPIAVPAMLAAAGVAGDVWNGLDPKTRESIEGTLKSIPDLPGELYDSMIQAIVDFIDDTVLNQ